MRSQKQILLSLLLTSLLAPAAWAARAYCWSIVIDDCESESHCDHCDDDGNYLGSTHVYYEC